MILLLIYAWSCSLREGGTSICMGLTLRNSEDCYVFNWLCFMWCFYFFFLYQLLPSSSCIAFGTIWSGIDEVFSVNATTNVFAFGDFNIFYEDWFVYSSGTERPQWTLLKWLTFYSYPWHSQSCCFGFIHFF